MGDVRYANSRICSYPLLVEHQLQRTTLYPYMLFNKLFTYYILWFCRSRGQCRYLLVPSFFLQTPVARIRNQQVSNLLAPERVGILVCYAFACHNPNLAGVPVALQLHNLSRHTSLVSVPASVAVLT
jgi:hypothetical protein